MDKVNTLLIELGNTLDIDRVTAYDNQMWAVYMSAGKEVEVQSLDEREELLFSIKVCQGEEAFELKKLQTLLEYNFLYRESGGVQFCINPENQEVHIQKHANDVRSESSFDHDYSAYGALPVVESISNDSASVG